MQALDDLGRQYPAHTVAQFAPEIRAQLDRLVARQYQSLGPELDVLCAQVDRLAGHETPLNQR